MKLTKQVTKEVTTTETVEEEISFREIVSDALDAMRKAGPEHFNMASWFLDRGANKEGIGIIVRDPNWTPNACGTSACMGGWILSTYARHGGKVVTSMQGDRMISEFRKEISQSYPRKDRDYLDVNWNPFAANYRDWPPLQRDTFLSCRTAGMDKHTAEWVAAQTLLVDWLARNPE